MYFLSGDVGAGFTSLKDMVYTYYGLERGVKEVVYKKLTYKTSGNVHVYRYFWSSTSILAQNCVQPVFGNLRSEIFECTSLLKARRQGKYVHEVGLRHCICMGTSTQI